MVGIVVMANQIDIDPGKHGQSEYEIHACLHRVSPVQLKLVPLKRVARTKIARAVEDP
jgi:hypothetical protein